MTGDPEGLPPSRPERARRPLPPGYREGFITAITVLLGFSLSFFRFWGFEAPGEWTARSLVVAVTLVVAVVLQIVALFRALLPSDDDEPAYRRTVTWFIASAVALLVGLLIAVAVFAGTPDPG
jgi:hypothetical protein